MKKRFLYLVFIAIIFNSCTPEEPLYYEDLDVVRTEYNENYSFDKNKTYAIPDKIIKVTGNLQQGDTPDYVKEPYNTKLLNQINKSMQEAGWKKVDDPTKANVTMLPAVWSNTTVYYWADYWCWYNPYYCGWGYYPYYGYTSSYTTGTFSMNLISNGSNYVEPNVVWSALINGLLSGEFDENRVTKGIEQAFDQSPYLKN